MLMGNPFKLNATLGRSYTVEPEDVKTTKQALVDLDYLKPRFKDDKGKPMSPVDDTPSPDLFAGIEAFQKDHGLTVDGLMKPDGETAKTLTDKLAERIRPARPKVPKPARPKAPKPARPNAARPNPLADPFDLTPKQANDRAKKAFAELDRRRREGQQTDRPPSGAVDPFAVDSAHKPPLESVPLKADGPSTTTPTPTMSARAETLGPSAISGPHDRPDLGGGIVLAAASSRDVPAGRENTTPDPEPQAAPQVAPQAAPKAPPPSVPANKTAWFKGREDEISDFHAAATKLEGVSDRQARAFTAVFAQEGGMQADKGGSAASGITQGTLNDLIARGKLSGVEPDTKPAELTVEQRARFSKAYFDDKLASADKGAKALDALPDDHAAKALADTVFRHGQDGAAEVIQNAVNRLKPGTLDPDGKMGPQTYGAYKTLCSDPKMRDAFFSALAEERWIHAQTFENHGPGDKVRADYFRTK